MNWITTLLGHLNYPTIFFLMMLESTVVPVPSELVVSPAAYHAASGSLNIWLVILFSTLGADLGATINYVVAYFVGRPLVYRFANSRLGHLCLLNQAKVESRMRWDKIDKMEYTKDLVRMALSSAVTLKESHDYDPEELRQQFGEVGRNLALYIYDLDIERQKQIINEEAEKCKAKPSCR